MRLFIFCLVSLVLSEALKSQDTIKGRLYDTETNEPLVGAIIQIPSTTNGSVTDITGSFILPVQSFPDSLYFRLVGYTTLKLKCNGRKYFATPMKSLPGNIEEIVVTASRYAQARNEAPMAIEKLNAATIKETRPTLLAELINKVPGVVMLNMNNEQHGMAIRQPMGTSPYYLYMEDGIPLRAMGVFNHNALIEMNLFSISSIEVIKGPASSLYGPEAVGGAINFITLKPTSDLTLKAGLHIDNYGYRRFQYGSGGKIGKKLGFYVGGFSAQQQNGWMGYSDYDKNSINLRMDYQLTKKTTLIASGAYNAYFSETPGSVDSIAFYERNYTSASKFTFRKVNSIRGRLSLEHEWDKNNHTTVHTFYRQNSIEQNPAYAIRWINGSTTAKGEINRNNFNSQGAIVQHVIDILPFKTQILAGASLDNSPVIYQAHQVDLSAKLRTGGNSVEEYSLISERPEIRISDYSANLYNSAAYLQLTIKPLRHLTIVMGGRFDEMRFRYHNYIDQSEGKKTFSNFTPKAGATYKINSSCGLYANYSLGFAPPGLTSIFTKQPGESGGFYYDLLPATFVNYEAGGWINHWKNKIRTTITVYQMRGKNELLNVRQPDNSTDLRSAGRTLHRGIEYNLVCYPVPGWMIRAGGTSALHRYEEFILSDRQSDLVKNVNGKTMPSAPSNIINTEISWRPKFADGLRLAIEWQYLSSWFQNQVNTVRYEEKGAFGMKGVSVLHLRAGYTWKKTEFFINVTNLSDELYAFNATRGNNPSQSSTFIAAPPRTFVVGMQINLNSRK